MTRTYAPRAEPDATGRTTIRPPTSSKQNNPDGTQGTTIRAPGKTSSVAPTRVTNTPRTPSNTAPGKCQPLLIDDWESQSRLTFLYYNALNQPSSDDASMKSVVVANDNTVTLTPKNTDSYFYSILPCVNAKSLYGGFAVKIKAASGTNFQLQFSSATTCGGQDTKSMTLSTSDLGWKFDGTLKSYSIPLSKLTGIDTSKMTLVFMGSLSKAVTLGPMSLYCGTDTTGYVVPAPVVNPLPTSTVPAPAGSAATLVVDNFKSESTNALGQWHGCDDDCIPAKYSSGSVSLQTTDSDLSWYTDFAEKCADITAYAKSYVHVQYSGSAKFTLSLQQHNSQCNPQLKPTFETWDSIEAERYATGGSDIYVPLSHFKVNLGRVKGFAVKGFYTDAATVLKKIELVPSVPSGFKVPNKLPSGQLVFACKRPNSFAFAIDDGDPKYAQQVMDIVKSENIKVTFFTVGLPLLDTSNNLSAVYKDMAARGHQIALHSYTHPKMEGLPDNAAIDWEYNNDIRAVSDTFGNGAHSNYFRPPFGTEGARMRQRLAAALKTDNPYLVMWSVDVEDWLWAESNTPQKQLDAFKRDVNAGGNLVVMHYLYPTTVNYLRQFIQIAKATGKQLMRVDQCMEDPNAPPL